MGFILAFFLLAPLAFSGTLPAAIQAQIDRAHASGTQGLDSWVRVSDLGAYQTLSTLQMKDLGGGDFPIEVSLEGNVIARVAREPLGEGSYMKAYLTSRGTALKIVKEAKNARKNLLLAWVDPILGEYEIERAKVLQCHPTGVTVEQEYVPGRSLWDRYSVTGATPPEAVTAQVLDTWKKALRLAKEKNIWLDFVPENHQLRRDGRMTNVDYSPRSSPSYYSSLMMTSQEAYSPEQFLKVFFNSVNRSFFFNLAERGNMSFRDADRQSMAHLDGGETFPLENLSEHSFLKYFNALLTSEEQIDRRLLTHFTEPFVRTRLQTELSAAGKTGTNPMAFYEGEGFQKYLSSAEHLSERLGKTVDTLGVPKKDVQVFVVGWGLEGLYNYMKLKGGGGLGTDQVGILRLSRSVLPDAAMDSGVDFTVAFQRYLASEVEGALKAGKTLVFVDSINSGVTLGAAAREGERLASQLGLRGRVHAVGFLESEDQRPRVEQEGNIKLTAEPEGIASLVNNPFPVTEIAGVDRERVMKDLMNDHIPRLFPGRYTHYVAGRPSSDGPWDPRFSAADRQDFLLQRLQAFYLYRRILDATRPPCRFRELASAL